MFSAIRNAEKGRHRHKPARPRTDRMRRDAYRRHLCCEPLEDRRLLSVSVGDLVWNDLNSNGVQNLGEPGVPGAVVEVFSSTDGIIGNADDVSRGIAITDANGNY